jgi:23S rRNA pseudouridine2605 synthase
VSPARKTPGQGGSKGARPSGGKPSSGKPAGKAGAGKFGGRSGPKASVNPASRSGKPEKPAPRPASPAAKRPARKKVGPTVAGLSKSGGTVQARDEGPMRVQRALARAGAVSRREADRAVADGRVLINGVRAEIGQTVDPARDTVTLDGRPIQTRVTAHRWIVLHKPAAVMTTRKDPAGRTTVFDLVDDFPGLVYVGRLDFMTEGVLLLTTDGAAAHALTHPSREVERTYVATVQGDAVTAAREARKGVQLEDGLVIPREVMAHSLGDRRWAFEITITEGRTHEVRRICDALGLEVERLVRTRFGPVRLGNLPSGEGRALSPTERDMLDALVADR